MQPRRFGILGFGAIGRSLVAALARAPVPGHQLTALLVRPHQMADAQAAVPPDVAVVTDLPALLALARSRTALIGHDIPGQVAKAGRSGDLHPLPAHLRAAQ